MSQHDRRDAGSSREPDAARPSAAEPGETRGERGLEGFARRAIEAGVQRMLSSDDGLRNLVGAVVPRELVGRAVDQVDAAKTEVVAVIGRELRTFLGSLNVGEELAKILTSVSFEVRMQVRFVPNEDGTLRAQVRAEPLAVTTAGDARAEASARADAAGPGRRRSLRSVAEQAVRAATGTSAPAAAAGAAQAAPQGAAQAATQAGAEGPVAAAAAAAGAASAAEAPGPIERAPLPGHDVADEFDVRARLARRRKLVSGVVGRFAEATAAATRVAAEVAADAAAEVVNRSMGAVDRDDDGGDDEGDDLDAY